MNEIGLETRYKIIKLDEKERNAAERADMRVMEWRAGSLGCLRGQQCSRSINQSVPQPREQVASQRSN